MLGHAAIYAATLERPLQRSYTVILERFGQHAGLMVPGASESRLGGSGEVSDRWGLLDGRVQRMSRGGPVRVLASPTGAGQPIAAQKPSNVPLPSWSVIALLPSLPVVERQPPGKPTPSNHAATYRGAFIAAWSIARSNSPITSSWRVRR